MTRTLNGRQWIDIVGGMAEAIQANLELLSKLDSAIGDGDHGSSMSRAMNAAKEEVSPLVEPSPSLVLRTLGLALMNKMGGASGIIFGSLYLGIAQAFGEDPAISVTKLAEGLAEGLSLVQKRGKAKPGDKTMVDALVPAVEAAKSAASRNAPMPELLAHAAAAARAGAEGTQSLVARHGRAKFLGERSIGHQDPGATSLAIMFQAWSEEGHD